VRSCVVEGTTLKLAMEALNRQRKRKNEGGSSRCKRRARMNPSSVKIMDTYECA
jgi:hypothetical protein